MLIFFRCHYRSDAALDAMCKRAFCLSGLCLPQTLQNPTSSGSNPHPHGSTMRPGFSKPKFASPGSYTHTHTHTHTHKPFLPFDVPLHSLFHLIFTILRCRHFTFQSKLKDVGITSILYIQDRKLRLEEASLAHVDGCVLSRFSRVRLFATLWTVARQAPLSMGFSRQEYCSGLPCSSPVHVHREKQMAEPRLKPSILESKSFSIFLP